MFLSKLILRELAFESEALKVSYVSNINFKSKVKHLILISQLLKMFSYSRVVIFQHISSNLEHKTSLFMRKDFVVFFLLQKLGILFTVLGMFN